MSSLTLPLPFISKAGVAPWAASSPAHSHMEWGFPGLRTHLGQSDVST